jgi:hypothetical protein
MYGRPRDCGGNDPSIARTPVAPPDADAADAEILRSPAEIPWKPLEVVI